MAAYQEIQNTLQYIETHLGEPLEIQVLADEAHLSVYYFQRLFSKLVGRPIAEYQKQRRLARALELLRQSDDTILDIALELGFGSHETFTRAFKAAFHMTPDEARRHERKLSGYTPVLMPDVTMAYTLVEENMPLVADGLILEISRRVYDSDRLFAGFRVNCTFGVPNSLNPGVVWNYLDDKSWRTLPYLHAQGCHMGIPGPRTDGQEGFSYFAGAQVTQFDDAFLNTRDWPGFDNLPDYLEHAIATIPAGEYLVCTYTTEDFSALVVDGMAKVHKYFTGTFIPNHGIQIDSPTIEIYDERSLRWHPSYRPREDVPHFAPCEPKLSQWEGPEMEFQIKVKG